MWGRVFDAAVLVEDPHHTVRLAAAHEVDDLQLVAFGKVGLIPLLAWNDVAIQFNGDPVALHAQPLNQQSEGERTIELTGLAIDLQFHG